MQKLLIASIFSLGLAVGSVTAQSDHCFKNDGLKLQQTVSFTVMQSKIKGTFESGGYDNDTSAETFEFTGTKTGNLLSVKFRGKPPYEIPPGTRSVVWTLGAKTLRIPMRGKNYNSGKYSTYTAVFTRCKEI